MSTQAEPRGETDSCSHSLKQWLGPQARACDTRIHRRILAERASGELTVRASHGSDVRLAGAAAFERSFLLHRKTVVRRMRHLGGGGCRNRDADHRPVERLAASKPGHLVLAVSGRLRRGGVDFDSRGDSDRGGDDSLYRWNRSCGLRAPCRLAAGPHRASAAGSDPDRSLPELARAHFQVGPPPFGSGDCRLVALLRGTSGLFAYDLACAIALATGILGVASVFARSRRSLLLLIGTLLLCVWFEYGRTGFFGKLAGYPGALFLIGILLTTLEWNGKATSALAILMVGAATIHSALSTVHSRRRGLFFVARVAVEGRRFLEEEQRIFVFAMSGLVALASSGMFGRVFGMPFGFPMVESWSWILRRLLEVQTPTLDIIPWSEAWLQAGTVIAMVLQFLLVGTAIYHRDARAFALVGGPMLIRGGVHVGRPEMDRPSNDRLYRSVFSLRAGRLAGSSDKNKQVLRHLCCDRHGCARYAHRLAYRAD